MSTAQIGEIVDVDHAVNGWQRRQRLQRLCMLGFTEAAVAARCVENLAEVAHQRCRLAPGLLRQPQHLLQALDLLLLAALKALRQGSDEGLLIGGLRIDASKAHAGLARPQLDQPLLFQVLQRPHHPLAIGAELSRQLDRIQAVPDAALLRRREDARQKWRRRSPEKRARISPSGTSGLAS